MGLEAIQGARSHLGVVGDKEGEAARGSDEVLQGGMRDGEAVMCCSTPSQLVYDDQRARRRSRKDAAGLRQLLQTCTQNSLSSPHIGTQKSEQGAVLGTLAASKPAQPCARPA